MPLIERLRCHVRSWKLEHLWTPSLRLTTMPWIEISLLIIGWWRLQHDWRWIHTNLWPRLRRSWKRKWISRQLDWRKWHNWKWDIWKPNCCYSNNWCCYLHCTRYLPSFRRLSHSLMLWWCHWQCPQLTHQWLQHLGHLGERSITLHWCCCLIWCVLTNFRCLSWMRQLEPLQRHGHSKKCQDCLCLPCIWSNLQRLILRNLSTTWSWSIHIGLITMGWCIHLQLRWHFTIMSTQGKLNWLKVNIIYFWR